MQRLAPTHQGGLCVQAATSASRRKARRATRTADNALEAKLAKSVAAASRRKSRVIKETMKAGDGERDRVKSYMSEVRAGRALTGTRQQQCLGLSSDIVSTMTVSDVDNREKIRTIMRSHYTDANDIIVVYDVTDRESFNNVKVCLGKIDKHAPDDGVNKLLVGNKCDLTSQEVMSTGEAKELADSLNLRPERC